MNFYLAVILCFSIFAPALLAVGRFEKIHRDYHPFIYLLWVGSINELLSFLLLMNRLPNFINNNVYGLIEAILIVLFFKNFPVLHKQRKLFYAIMAINVITWGIENLIFNQLYGVGMYFRLTYSFIVVLLSISTINGSLIDARVNVIKNPEFLICAAFILYFTFKIMIEMFWLYGLNTSGRFQLLVYDILNYINLFCNLIFMFAVLWMPRKQVFTMR